MIRTSKAYHKQVWVNKGTDGHHIFYKYHNNLKFNLLVYDTSGCNSQDISWLPSNRYLNRSKLTSTRLCSNHIIIEYSLEHE